MTRNKTAITVPDEIIISKIYLIRGNKVMLDNDLAQLYGVETKVLKQAVRRNSRRFPQEFMFELNSDEFAHLRSHFVTSSWGGIRYAPMAFTEQGVAMLSSVLKSERAIIINIHIIRVFTKMRKLIETHSEILRKLEYLEKKDIEQDKKIILILKYIRQLEKIKKDELKRNKRTIIIGYKGYRSENPGR
jgi:hypothetical protein